MAPQALRLGGLTRGPFPYLVAWRSAPVSRACLVTAACRNPWDTRRRQYCQRRGGLKVRRPRASQRPMRVHTLQGTGAHSVINRQSALGRSSFGIGNGSSNSRSCTSLAPQSSRVTRIPSGESSAMRTCSHRPSGSRSSKGSARKLNPISSSVSSAVSQSTTSERALPNRSTTTNPSPSGAIHPISSPSPPRRCSIHSTGSTMPTRVTGTVS